MEDILVDLPDNPVPVQTDAGRFTTPDGVLIRYALFPTIKGNANGTIIILHGRNECIEKYFETVGDLRARGFGVATFDWRGQGGSGRLLRDPMRGYVESFHDYVSDIQQFFREIVLPDCKGPFYIVAHSTGALIAQLAAPKLSNQVERMVLSAPMLGLQKIPVPQSVVHAAAAFLHAIGLGSLYIGGGPRPRETQPFEGNLLTTDPERYKRNSHLYEVARHLALGGPTAAWLNAAFNAINQVTDRDFCTTIRIPSLLVQAGADAIVSNHAIEMQAARLRSGSLLTIDGARHELLQETDYYRQQLIAAIESFFLGEKANRIELTAPG